MKKVLLLLASAALLLVGCAKEQMSKGVDGEMTQVTFTANIESGVTTKAVADGDGLGHFVNRCIMEIYFQDQLYKRLIEPLEGNLDDGPLKASFSNVPVVAGKQYKVLFWADHVDNADTPDGLEEDKYYDTDSQTGLKAVTIIKDAFIGELEEEGPTKDYLDAFFGAKDCTVTQDGSSFDIQLTRPFAQLNVITTDVGTGKTVFKKELLPETVSVSYKADNTINVATGEISRSGEEADYTYTYEAPVYGNWEETVTDSHKELTLSMDYILASDEQGTVDVAFKTLNGTTEVMNHSLSNLPYRRNYRTNVKGDLLTVGGSWIATIAPDWGNGTDSGEINHIIASSYTEVVNALQSSRESDKVKVTVTPAAVNNLSDTEKSQVIVDETIDGEAVKALKFILYEEKKDGDQITQQASPEHVEFELPARPEGVKAWKIEYEQAYPTETVVVSTKEEDNANVIIEAPKSTVTLEARKVNSVVSTTAESTLIIPQGLELKNLTVKKGAVEYHGTGLTKVTVATTGEDKAYFKTSEGLADTDDVYGVVKDHVAPGYAITKETESTWKIVPAVCTIGETSYGSVADAFAAVENDQTIVMQQNDILTKGQTITLADNEAFTLDLNGKTISIAETGFDFTANHTNSALRNGVPVRFAIVVNGAGTMNICDNSTDGLGRIETKNHSYGTTKTILVDGNAVVNVNSGTIAADYAAFYVVGFTETTAVPVDAPKPTLNVNGGKIIGQQLGIGIKGNTATLKVTAGEIVGEEAYGVSTNGTQDWYDGGKFAIEITGGLIKSVEGNAMYLPAEGPTVITGGTIEGATGIAVKGGSLSISENAVVKANGPYAEAKSVSSGNANTGSAIYVEDTYSDHAPLVNISGGKFSSVNNKAVEYYTTKADDAADKGKITLTGGVYSDKPADEFVANQYIVVENEDAAYPWKVEIDPDAVTVAKIGTTEYYSLSEALSAAKDGEAVYIIPNQLEETVNASNDNNIQLILDGKNIIGDITFGGKGTLIVRAEELNTDYYSHPKAYEVDAPTIPAQGAGGIMGKISATGNATVMLRENLYSGPFEGNVELRGGFYYSELGLDNIKAQTPNGIGIVAEQVQEVQGYSMYYVPEVPESYLVHIQNVTGLLDAYNDGQLSDDQINQITLGYGLSPNIIKTLWGSVDGGEEGSSVPSGNNYFPDDVYAFFTNLKDGEYDNPKYAYQEWHCDYEISYSSPIQQDYQSGIWGYYGQMALGVWLPKNATEQPFAMLGAVNMKRTYSQMLSEVGMFLCGPVNLNPADTGKVITVNLNIYPYSEDKTKFITTNKVVYTIPAISE